MDKKHSLIEKIIDEKTFSQQRIPGQPVIEIIGHYRILIENHCGVREYGHEKIGVQVPFGMVCIVGCNLELIHMTKEQVVISGTIQCVHLQQKERK